MLKQRTILVLDGIINEKNNAESIDTIDISLLNLSKPKSYNGNKSIEVLYNKQFEAACVLITQQLNTNAKKMTVFEFYTAFEQLKKQKPQNKNKQR